MVGPVVDRVAGIQERHVVEARTIEAHPQTIHAKLGVRSRVEPTRTVNT
jgi:DNA-binding CsgD family transcriptional regulator